MVGLVGAVGKTGFYSVVIKFVDDVEEMSHVIGGGIAPNLISMWVENNDQKEFNLNEHHLGDAGIIALAKSIVANKSTVENLDLRENNIGVEGALALAEMLKVNASLKSISPQAWLQKCS